MNALDALARFYDLDYGEVTEDLLFYRSYAQRTGGPVLELGVGTGRVALPLAQAGFRVVGLDSSEAMLEAARGKIPARLKRRLRLVYGDMQEFALEERFPLAFIAANTFAHITLAEDRIRTLECVRGHLTEGGLLILALSGQLGPWGRAGEVLLDWVKQDPSTGNTIAKFVSIQYDPTRQIQEITFIYDEVDEEGRVRRTIVTFPLRYTSLPELELLLNQSSFAVEAVYGSYDLEPYRSESEHLIVVARRSL